MPPLSFRVCLRDMALPARNAFGGEVIRHGPLTALIRLLRSDQTQVFPWVGHPDYNLTTDMADDAINYMRGLNNAAPDKPFFIYYVPGGSHAPHQPTPEWIKKISDMHLFDQGWEKLRETSTRARGQRLQ